MKQRSHCVWVLLHMEDDIVVYGPKLGIDHIEKICATLNPPIEIHARTEGVEVYIRSLAENAIAQGFDVTLEDGQYRHPYPEMNQNWSLIRYRNKNVIYGLVASIDYAHQNELFGDESILIKRLDVKRYIIEESLRDTKLQQKYNFIYIPELVVANDVI